MFTYIMIQDVDELNRHDHAKSEDDDKEEEEEDEEDESSKWEPSGSWWRDFLYFSGPGEDGGRRRWTTENRRTMPYYYNIPDPRNRREDVSSRLSLSLLVPRRCDIPSPLPPFPPFPGWFVSIAYVDPGNYQADIQAGATSRYSLLFALWWTAVLSIYVQVLCVRLAFHSNLTLSQAQARMHPTRGARYFHWAIAEFSTIITDLPTVVGFAM